MEHQQKKRRTSNVMGPSKKRLRGNGDENLLQEDLSKKSPTTLSEDGDSDPTADWSDSDGDPDYNQNDDIQTSSSSSDSDAQESRQVGTGGGVRRGRDERGKSEQEDGPKSRRWCSPTGREHVRTTKYGDSYIFLAPNSLKPSSIEAHVNDLLTIFKAYPAKKKRCLILLTDDGDDYGIRFVFSKPQHTCNQYDNILFQV